MNRVLGHLSNILVHKYYVLKYCIKAGIIWRGIVHDLSKFSPVEFWESVKWYQGDSSPIDACKKATGVSKAWLHHKGRNSHHYEYWVDYLDNGGKPAIMPYEDSLEMVCDSLGAGEAYSRKANKKFTYAGELLWWQNKKKTNPKIHPQTLMFLDEIFTTMKKENSCNVLREDRSLEIYNNAMKIYKTSARK